MIEWAVALEARGAGAVVELEAPCSHHNPQAVVGMAARRALGVAAQGEPVRSGKARDDVARSALCEKARSRGAVSGLQGGARWGRLSARNRWTLFAARILHWLLNVQYRSGNTENHWGIVVDILDRFSFQPHLWWRILIFAPIKIKITPCDCLRSERLPLTFLRDAIQEKSSRR